MTQELNTVQGRNEVLQPILDRLLYLPDDQKEQFVSYLETLNNMYKLDVQIINGIRIYDIKKFKK
jgi:hypothetical protein